MTGVPEASASRITSGNPSSYAGKISASEFTINDRASSWLTQPVKVTRSPIPSSAAIARYVSTGPPPAIVRYDIARRDCRAGEGAEQILHTLSLQQIAYEQQAEIAHRARSRAASTWSRAPRCR